MRFIFDKIGNSFIRNASYSVLASILSFVVGVTVILLVPKVIGVVDYGYFQFFILLISCSGFTHFGWSNGILLRYAGIQWKNFNRPRFAGQIHFFLAFEVALWGVFAWASYLYFGEEARLFVLLCAAFGAILVLFDSLLRCILQAANRIKIYAFLNLLERSVYLGSVLIAIFSGVKDFRLFIIAYLLARVIAVIAATWFCRSLIFCKGEAFCNVLEEAKKSLQAGAKLMFADIASLMILYVIRFGIEYVWGIAAFGKISLLISSLSVLFIFTSAISAALLPALRRENTEHIRDLYFPSRIALSWFLLICFIFSYPAIKILCIWLPNYADAIVYLPLILPICLFDAAVRLLISTYLMVMRREKDFLIGNCVALVISIVLFIVCGLILKNLTLTVLSMTIAIAIRAWILEKMLSVQLKVNTSSTFVLEITASIVLITSGFFVGGWSSVLIYICFLVIAFIINRKKLIRIISITKCYWKKHSLQR